VVDQGRVRNAFEVHLVNKQGQDVVFELQGKSDARLRYTISMPHIVLSELRGQRVPVFIDFADGAVHSGERAELELKVQGELVRTLQLPLLAPIRR
jgi:hypothetical protein